MAELKSVLDLPENGWSRYSITNSKIVSNEVKTDDGRAYGGSYFWLQNQGDYTKFSFYGSKIRLITATGDENIGANINGGDYNVTIDGVPFIGNNYGPLTFNVLTFEKTDLSEGMHSVIISNKVENRYIWITAIDIEATGALLTPIGKRLTTPDPKWRRYEDNNLLLVYRGSNWLSASSSIYSGGTCKYIVTGLTPEQVATNYVEGKFKGTSIRFIASRYMLTSEQVGIYIDGLLKTTFNVRSATYDSALDEQILLGEVFGLEDVIHTFQIKSLDGIRFALDAIDIDEDGKLMHFFLPEKTSINNMQVGDVISCDLTGEGNFPLSFSNLGSSIKRDIFLPRTVTDISGSFYFVMVGYDSLGRKKLVADRPVYSGIWDNLNNRGLIDSQTIKIERQNLISEKISSNTTTEGTVVFSNNNPTYSQPYMVFDDDNTMWTSGVTNASTTEYIGFVFNELQNIDTVSLSSVTITDQYFKTIKIESTLNGTTWTTVKTVSNCTPGYHEIDVNLVNVKGCRIVFTEYNPGTWVGLRKLRFFKNNTKILNNYTIHTMTGGLNSSDKNNEYDKIMMEYNLDGHISLSDLPSLWHFEVDEWTSTTHSSGLNYRVIRKGNSYSSALSSATAGWRPVLIVENLDNTRFLIKKDNTYYGVENYTSIEIPTYSTYSTYGIMKEDIKTFIESRNITLPFKLMMFSWENAQSLVVNGFKDYSILNSKLPISLIHLKEFNSILLSGSNIKVALSVNNLNWKRFDGSLWQTVYTNDTNKDNLYASLNTPEEILALTDSQIKQLVGTTEEPEFYLYIMFGSQGELDKISLNVDLKGYFLFSPSEITIPETHDRVNIKFLEPGNYKVKHKKIN